MAEQSPQSMHHTQKTGFILLSVFAVCVLVLGVFQFRTIIYGPFALAPRTQDDTERAQIEELFDNEDTRLQRIDTDQDGLNDFEELHFYNTSPYIADTDSDGISDLLEVQNGSDPICPTGSDCSIYNPDEDDASSDEAVGTSELFGSTAQDTEILFDTIGAITGDGSSNVQVPVDDSVDFETLPTDIQDTVAALIQDPEAIRALLRQSGTLTEAEIAAFSDELLIETAISLLTE